LHSAFAAFGFNTTEGGFKLIRTAVGNDLYIAALRKADYPEAELIFDDPKPENRPQETSNEGVVLPPPSSIREAVLDLAKAAFPQAVFAAELRKALEKQRGGTLHDKTIGMTLYRLSKDGLMRREGQKNWFYVPPLTAETKNPGAEDAGAFNRDDKEGEAL
jgi:hypothetical protein